MHIKTWHVELFIYEDDDTVSARAVLHSDAPEHKEGRGVSHRGSSGSSVPEIGDEIAAARALQELSSALMAAATEDISGISGVRVHFHRS